MIGWPGFRRDPRPTPLMLIVWPITSGWTDVHAGGKLADPPGAIVENRLEYRAIVARRTIAARRPRLRGPHSQ